MQLTAEDSFLLRCVRVGLGGEFIDHNKVPPLDWGLLREAAERHQVQPLVYEAIKEGCYEDRLPADVRNALLLEYHRTGMRNESIGQRIGHILREAAGKGIEVMLLKGAVLAYGTYARPEHRGFGDVDLLVRERDFRGLREVHRCRSCVSETYPATPTAFDRYGSIREPFRRWRSTFGCSTRACRRRRSQPGRMPYPLSLVVLRCATLRRNGSCCICVCTPSNMLSLCSVCSLTLRSGTGHTPSTLSASFHWPVGITWLPRPTTP